ncbi:hypothetical protein SANTM175S_04199 [Streptomyces antimycoticus]
MLLGSEPDQPGPQQRSAPQIERARPFVRQQLRQLRLPPVGGEVGQIVRLEPDLPGVVHDLHAAAVHRVEGGPQRLMPGHQRGQRRAERVHIEGAAHPQRQRGGVLGAVRCEGVQEPQTLLRIRQRQLAVPGHRDDRGGPVPGAAVRATERLGQGGDGRMGEDQAGRGLHSEHLPQP